MATATALEKSKSPSGADSLDMESRVIYLGRIPNEFQEPQMRSYFQQFGRVTRLRLSRNPKTLAPRHYGFVEFESAAIARIVAHAMNNYLLSGHLLQCHVIPCSRIHERMFRGLRHSRRELNKRKFTAWMSEEDSRKQASLIGERVSEINQKHAARLAKKNEKLKEFMGGAEDFALPTLHKLSLQPIIAKARAEAAAAKASVDAKEDWEVEYAEELAALSQEE